LKHEPKEVLERFWALRFVASNADLLIGKEIFEIQDEPIRRVLHDRWGDFPGAVICAAREESRPGPVDTQVTIEPGGTVRIEPIAEPVPPSG
jgi:hypothetical protein